MYSSPILSALIFSDIRNPSGKFQYITSQKTRCNTDGEKKEKERAYFTLVLCVFRKRDE